MIWLAGDAVKFVRSVRQVRRYDDVGIVVWRIERSFGVFTVRIERGQPHEERFVFGAFFQGAFPVFATGRLFSDHLRWLPAFSRWQYKPGLGGFVDFVEVVADYITQVPLFGSCSVVTG